MLLHPGPDRRMKNGTLRKTAGSLYMVRRGFLYVTFLNS